MWGGAQFFLLLESADGVQEHAAHHRSSTSVRVNLSFLSDFEEGGGGELRACRSSEACTYCSLLSVRLVLKRAGVGSRKCCSSQAFAYMVQPTYHVYHVFPLVLGWNEGHVIVFLHSCLPSKDARRNREEATPPQTCTTSGAARLATTSLTHSLCPPFPAHNDLSDPLPT